MAAPVQVQKSFVPLAKQAPNGQILIAEEWRRMLEEIVRAIEDLRARVTALE